jgi:hypothetical protein
MRLQITRRAALQLVAAAPVCLRKDARADAAPAMCELMELAIDPHTVTLAPEAALQRIVFLGASSAKEEGERWLVYRLEDGQLTRGSLRFSKLGENRWRLDRMQLFFAWTTRSCSTPCARR